MQKLLARCNELGKMQFDIPKGTKEFFVNEGENKPCEENLQEVAAGEAMPAEI